METKILLLSIILNSQQSMEKSKRCHVIDWAGANDLLKKSQDNEILPLCANRTTQGICQHLKQHG